MKKPELFNEANRATYSPEDNKIRLYVGRVPREEYDALRAEGWQATAKQDCDFSAVWTVARKDTAESYAGIIEDEDMTPQDRAADRAERFARYLSNRIADATGHADRYDAGPQAHGFQSYARAVRSADRHDRIASRAVDAWSKAEYWQSRTAGVISHALHVSSPGVRMGRIKTIEAEKRAMEKRREESAARYRRIEAIAANPGEALASLAARFYDGDEREAERTLISEIAGHGKIRNPLRPQDPPAYDFEILKQENPPTLEDFAAWYLRRHAAPGSPEWEETGTAQFIRHCELRLAYENQMLEAQGGRAALIEMEVGGWIGGHQIRKVNKSPATGRVVSVAVSVKTNGKDQWGNEKPGIAPTRLETVNIERLAVSSYRAPTDEDRASLAATVKAEKARVKEAAKGKPAPASIVNPTPEDAERLQLIIAEQGAASRRSWGEKEVPTVLTMTQARYSEISKGTYARAGVAEIRGGGLKRRVSHSLADFPAVVKVRMLGDRIIVLSDKPQKALPATTWQDPAPAMLAEVLKPENVETLATIQRLSIRERTEEQETLIQNARRVGVYFVSSWSQFGFTDEYAHLYRSAVLASQG